MAISYCVLACCACAALVSVQMSSSNKNTSQIWLGSNPIAFFFFFYLITSLITPSSNTVTSWGTGASTGGFWGKGTQFIAHNKEHKLASVWGYWKSGLFSLMLYSHHVGKCGPNLGGASLSWRIVNNKLGLSSGQDPGANSMKCIILDLFFQQWHIWWWVQHTRWSVPMTLRLAPFSVNEI